MLTSRLLAALIAAGLVGGVACSTASDAQQPAPAASAAVARPLVTPPPGVAAFPPDAHHAQGAQGILRFKSAKDGNLSVAVEARWTPQDGLTTTATYVRSVDCRKERLAGGYIGGCRVAWQKNVKVPAESFTYDAALDTATFTGRVGGKDVRVTWKGTGEVVRSIGENGNLLVEMRDAHARLTWGATVWKDADAKPTAMALYRRATAAIP